VFIHSRTDSPPGNLLVPRATVLLSKRATGVIERPTGDVLTAGALVGAGFGVPTGRT
jgi:hypothetical protein